jgi:uncharacterized protein YegP (UPF0339 family)
VIKLHYNPNLGQWWFTLLAKNNKVLMTSEMYNSKKAAENGIRAASEAALRLVEKGFSRVR